MSVQWLPLPVPTLEECANSAPDGFWDMVQAVGDEVADAINEVFKWLWDMIDSHIDVMAGILGAAAGSAIAGPVGGILGGVGGYLAGGALQDWAYDKANAAFDKVNQAFKDWWDKVCWFARQVFGDPAELYLNYLDYNTQTTSLSELINDLTTLKSRVDTYWDGVAAEEYVNEVDKQLVALGRLKDNAKMLSVISSGGAIDVYTGWLWLPLQMGRVAVAILGVIAGAFDAGKLILGEAGPIIEFVNVGLEFVLDARDEVLERIEASIRAGAELSSETSDTEGFPDGHWPKGDSPEVLNSPANWDPAEVY